MTLDLTKQPLQKHPTKGAILRALGLPPATKWHEAAPVVKQKIAALRRAGDDVEAAEWSHYQSILKSTLLRACPRCGATVKAGRMYCRMHTPQNSSDQRVGWRKKAPATHVEGPHQTESKLV